jgi:hypothetical protein
MSTKDTEALGSKPMKAKDNNPVAQIHREAATQDMEEAPSKPQVMSGWRWLRIVFGVVVAVMVYVSGAITARVMVERGYFRIDSPTARGLEFVYLPLKSLLDASPAGRDAFESCAAFFVARGYHLHGWFRTLQTLKPGDPVIMAGVQIGYVASIALDPARAEMRVTMHIKRSVVVKTDSTATINLTSSPGQSAIVLDGGSASGRVATPDSILMTREKPSSDN